MDHLTFAQMLGSYGEFVGAIAVVATLLYLSIQIRQNSNTIGGGTEMDLARELAAWHSRVTSQPDLIGLYEKGATNESMTEAETLRYRWLIAELLYIYEGAFRQHKRGLISDESWNQYVVSTIGLLRPDVIRAWWEQRTSALSDEFFTYIETRRIEDDGQGWKQRSVSS